jgi:uncharacterized membrane protein YhaH (DUF805 family)
MFTPGDYYLVAMTLIFGATYFALYFFIPFLVGQKPIALSRRSLYSVLIIVGSSIATSFIASIIPDLALSNRFLHAIGGGFLAMLVCFLASMDSRVSISKFQLISISFLISAFLGVGNELAEFALQSITGFPFTDSLIDTWLDLTSNTVGAALGVLCLAPLIKNRP